MEVLVHKDKYMTHPQERIKKVVAVAVVLASIENVAKEDVLLAEEGEDAAATGVS
jgi:hypothetical protein